jgi:hypothetical protein
LNITKNFTIGDIAALIIGGSYVPYVGATANVDLGAFSITASSFIVPGGLATQFVKADGTLDSTVYQPAGNYITQLSGEATASGPGNASVTLSNSAVIGKVLTGLTITGSAIVATDSILTAFGKVQNQINTLVGGVQYKGTWNAATNTPTLVSSVGVQGNYYVVNVAGNTNLNGITDWNLGDWAIFNGSAWEKVDNTDAVISVNGQTGAVVLTTTNIAEGTNLYYTDLRARQAISLTTTGSSGASTYSYLTGILNVPNYTLAGLGGVPLTRQLTINGTAFDLSADRSWSVGTVTSIATTGPLTGGTITGSGTIGITQASASSDGYLSSTDWTTFNNKQNAITDPVTGTGTPNTLPMWGSTTSLVNSPLSYAADTFNFQYNSATGGTVNFTNIGLTTYTYSIQMNNFGAPRSTVHSYTDGLVIQSIGGTQVSRMFANGNTILGTGVVDNGYKLELSGTFALRATASASAATQIPVFTADPSGTTRALVTRTPAQLIADAGGIAGTLATGQVAFGTATNTIGGDNGLFWDNTNKRLGIGTAIPSSELEVLSTDSDTAIRITSGLASTTTGTSTLRLQSFNSASGVVGSAEISNTAPVGGQSVLLFSTSPSANTPTERWRITQSGILQSNGTQTIRASTGNLILTSADNIGIVDIQRNDRALGGELRITNSFNGTGWIAGDVVGTLNFVSTDTSTTQPIRSQIQAINTATTTYPALMNLTFSTANLNTLTEGFRLTNLSNLLIGSTTDSGQRLQVTGTTFLNGQQILQGITASDTAPLGPELTTTGTGTNWTGSDFATGYTHVIGSTAALTTTLAAVVGTYYQITYTVTGRTTGTFTINYGGTSTVGITATGNTGPVATTTDTLVIFPTTDFNGTIVLSVKTISNSSATTIFRSSAGTTTNEIRVSDNSNNFFVGLNTGRRNTTGVNNAFIGTNSGVNNTTASNNTFVGRGAGFTNSIGASNSFFGASAGFANTTASNNSFFGYASGNSNTTGTSNSFFGVQAGAGNTTGIQNTFLGVNSAATLNTGSNNVMVGVQAGRFLANGTTALAIADNSVFLGFDARANGNSETNQIVIGHTAIGGGSNTVVIGNSSIVSNRFFGTMRIGTINNGVGDFITTDVNGVLTRRTAAQTLTDIGAQGALTLTTTGTSGPATLIGNTLNIPQYTDQFVGTVTSVGLTMPAAFTVSNSPITSAGTIAVTGAGNASQYVRGDGTLADFPTTGGGGSSVSYYLNGSVSQGTIVGVAYYEMSKVPILGAGTDFSIAADGYIASFITDAGDPNLLEIPGGNWNFETYFSASSGGGTPTFYVELYKYNGTTFTLIASSSGTPELISFGTNIQPYFSTLAVPQTTLLATDRLAVRYYVAHSGRTITLHTEDNHLCQIITTFTTGLTALNGLTDQVQYFQVGTTGTDFNIVSSVDTHSFNLPTASAVNRGALSSADWTTFNSKIGGTLATGQVAFGTAANTIGGDNGLFWDNTNKRLGVGTTAVGSFDSVPPLVVGGGTADSGIVIYTSNATSGYLQFADGTSGAEEYRGFIKYDHATNSMSFSTNSIARTDAEWQITSTGVFQSNGAQTIQTSTGNLTLATGGGNGDIILTPNGTGIALIQNTVVGNIASFLSNTANGQRLNISSTATGVKIGSEFNTGISGTFEIFASGGSSTLLFGTVSIERWRITNTGVLQSNGLQTIQTSTGNLTIATGGGNGNIILTPNGTGNVGVGVTPSGAKLDVLGNFRVRRDIFANQYLDITSSGGFVNLLAYNGNSSTIYQELIFQSGHTADTVERWRITSTGALQSNGAQTIQTSTGNLILTSADNTGVVDIQRNIRASGAELRLSNASNSSSWVAGDIVGTINFYLPNDTSTTQPIRSQIQAISLGSGTTYPANMGLTFSTANVNTLTEGFRLTNLSNLLLGTQTDVASSIFTMDSTTKGFLPPRMTAAQRTAIASPAEGLIVYQTDSVIGLYIYANATWRTLGMI